MAHVYTSASITPTKLELISAWLPQTTWFGQADPAITLLGAYRFDDPDGDVGIETHLLLDPAGRTLQVPLTYRSAPIAGGEAWLACTMEHSVLGPRWIYDACGDPVYAAVLATTILTGGTQAELQHEDADGSSEIAEPVVRVSGSGVASTLGGVGLIDVRDEGEVTTIVTSVGELLVRRVIDPMASVAGDLELTGTWPGVDDPTVLVMARP